MLASIVQMSTKAAKIFACCCQLQYKLQHVDLNYRTLSTNDTYGKSDTGQKETLANGCLGTTKIWVYMWLSLRSAASGFTLG